MREYSKAPSSRATLTAAVTVVPVVLIVHLVILVIRRGFDYAHSHPRHLSSVEASLYALFMPTRWECRVQRLLSQSCASSQR